MLSQKSVRWRRALSPRKASLPHEDWVLRGLTLHQLKDIMTDIYASKAKADARSGPTSTPVKPLADTTLRLVKCTNCNCDICLSSWAHSMDIYASQGQSRRQDRTHFHSREPCWKKKRNEKTAPSSVNSMRSHALHGAAQGLCNPPADKASRLVDCANCICAACISSWVGSTDIYVCKARAHCMQSRQCFQSVLCRLVLRLGSYSEAITARPGQASFCIGRHMATAGYQMAYSWLL